MSERENPFLYMGQERRLDALLATRGEPDPDGSWCLYWLAPVGLRAPSGPETSYATREQAEAALSLLIATGQNPVRYSARQLVNGRWT